MRTYLALMLLGLSTASMAAKIKDVSINNVIDGSIGRCEVKADVYSNPFGAYLIHTPKTRMYGDYALTIEVKYNRYLCRDIKGNVKFIRVKPKKAYAHSHYVTSEDNKDLVLRRTKYQMTSLRLMATNSHTYDILGLSTVLGNSDSRMYLHLDLRKILTDDQLSQLMEGKTIKAQFDINAQSNYEITSIEGEVSNLQVTGGTFRMFLELSNIRGQIASKVLL